MQKILPRLNQLAASIALAAGGAALMPTAQAAAPTAGSDISNIATASYTDGNGASKTVTSNEIKTTVLQVSSFTLVADRNATINPNGTATLSHTLTNTGNGTDTFTLNVSQLGGDNFDLTNVHIYLDSNQDGVPDNNTDLSTVTLNAGQSVGIIVVSTVPVTQTDGQKAQYTLNATAGFDTTVKGSNTDTVTVTAGAALSLIKSASVASNGDITYTLTYRNTGNADATNVEIDDALDLTKVTYVSGSAKWNAATALTDAVGGDPTGINYYADPATGKIAFVLDKVAKNTTGTVTFKVQPKPNNSAIITNTATIIDLPENDDSVDTDPSTPLPATLTPSPSNTTIVTNKVFTGTVNDSLTDAYADPDPKGDTPTTDDTIKSSTTQGTPVVFGDDNGSTDGGPDKIVIHNTGNATETYNVTYDKSDLEVGSIVQLFKADGATPLTDTNGDGIVDTGPIAAGSTAQIRVKVTLPTGYSTPVDPATSDDVIVKIKPISDSTAKADTITLSIVDVTPATVDLFKDDNTDTTTGTKTPGATGLDTGSPVESISVAGGQPAYFQIDVKNSGATPDNFNLTNSTLPSGWTVQYFKDDGTGKPTGSALTNTGNIAPGATVNLVAVVTPPANAPVSTTPVVFTVTSPVTGLSDSLTDEVKVKETRQLTLVSDNSGQVAPGGTVTYTHTLTNNGNLVEGGKDGDLPFTLTNSGTGWKTTVYIDFHNFGVVDADEIVTGNDLATVLKNYDPDNNGIKGLEQGQSVKLIVKVEAPSNAGAGTQDTATLTVSPTATAAGTQQSPLTNTDLTTVNDGQVRLVKKQALDAACDGTADGSFTQNNLSAKPGTCVIYRITATNEGNVPVTTVEINDNVPTYTTLVSGSESNNNTSGTVTVNGVAITNRVATLSGNTSAQLQFTVKIDE
nr:hypothetical protein [Moraxella sp. CTOTU48841]